MSQCYGTIENYITFTTLLSILSYNAYSPTLCWCYDVTFSTSYQRCGNIVCWHQFAYIYHWFLRWLVLLPVQATPRIDSMLKEVNFIKSRLAQLHFQIWLQDLMQFWIVSMRNSDWHNIRVTDEMEHFPPWQSISMVSRN